MRRLGQAGKGRPCSDRDLRRWTATAAVPVSTRSSCSLERDQAGHIDGAASMAAGAGSDVGPVVHQLWPLVSILPPLGPVETAPACGRHHTRAVLSEWKLGHFADDAALLVTELMTNAMKASRRCGTPVCLRILADSEQLIIEVWDRSPDEPEPRRASYADEDGRGLSVIQSVSHQWGSYFSGGWKVVWSELRTSEQQPGRRPG